MKILVIFVAIFVLFAGIFFFSRTGTKTSPGVLPSLAPSPSTGEQTVNIDASFTIITGSTTRSFNAEKYHNRSKDVFIEASNPSIINVKKKGITWDDFFRTLPMSLTKECLTTGDGETLCEGKGGVLKFYLNDTEDKDLLDKQIKQNDKALIKFTPY